MENGNLLVAKKMDHWRSRLIDLSLRNRLLNFKLTKSSTVQFIEPAMDTLFDFLAKKNKPMAVICPEIRDEMDVTFLVVSELSRSLQGGYDDLPNLGSFKESGDIEYTADNALIMTTEGSVYDREGGDKGRTVHLWLVASREMSPGKVADYQVEFPYWSFREL